MKGQSHAKIRIIIGLTGSFGSGKTTVAKIFKSLGAKIIDADRIAHNFIKPGTNVYRRIVDTFSKDILGKNKTIDRNKLAKIVFDNKTWLKKLNNIIQPQVIRLIKKETKILPKEFLVLDAPLLIEAGLMKMVDKLIVVKIGRKKQIERLLNKTSLSINDILKRIKTQMPLSEKIRIADFVIDNSGTISQTKKQVKRFFLMMKGSKRKNRKGSGEKFSPGFRGNSERMK